MARYDRIARLTPPGRDECFPGWLSLRDLQGREREPDLGRRARLRFLALRPLRRLLLRGLEETSADSLRLQLEGVRDEIERLDERDPERSRLIGYLTEIGGRSPVGLLAATLDVGAAAEAAGHSYAAEEFYRTGLELAREHALPLQEARALRRLARVHRPREEWEPAIELGREAAAVADAAGEPVQWAMALEEVARAETGRGQRARARAVLDEVAERGLAEGNDHLRAVAAAARCALELGAEEFDLAITEGARAVELFPPTDPHRNRALLDTASALRRVGLWAAAEACYGVVETHSTWVEHRAEAATERAVVAAERGDPEGFRRRRERIIEIVDSGDLRLRALLHLGLGRGCLIAGDVDHGREHLRQAISSARDADLDSLLASADELLNALERGQRLTSPGLRPASAGSRETAASLQERFGARAIARG